ncbi:serine aminopeptidase domain-containing protein [Variovorax sp. YR216]|uniref:serine aminopeptidase domain-containing protein n=1 Tax=Variovorax sp. YR216 TaxID=1882828 RepID=UPI0008987E8F|nr:alpha/beta hydrolase [Variovorax sp. YR216]SEA99142.1 Serine aminopeptidase, S33 [Variovorax sp. YR216]
MTPMLFGPPSRQLFGLFHAPERDSNLAVLICMPIGQEAIRAHRLFRVLSDRLARSGTAVLRFDYHGTGDSPGDDLSGELEGWRRDVCTAHEELRRRVGGRRILWLGARLGASAAVLAAKSGHCDPARLILWDPIIDGARYIDSLRASHVDALEHSFCVPDPDWRRRLAKDSDAFTDELLGFGVSPVLRQQLRALSPKALQLTALHQTTVLADPEDRAAQEWARAESERRMPVTLSSFQHPLVWTSDPQPNNAMVPAEALQRLMAEAHD